MIFIEDAYDHYRDNKKEDIDLYSIKDGDKMRLFMFGVDTDVFIFLSGHNKTNHKITHDQVSTIEFIIKRRRIYENKLIRSINDFIRKNRNRLFPEHLISVKYIPYSIVLGNNNSFIVTIIVNEVNDEDKYVILVAEYDNSVIHIDIKR